MKTFLLFALPCLLLGLAGCAPYYGSRGPVPADKEFQQNDAVESALNLYRGGFHTGPLPRLIRLDKIRHEDALGGKYSEFILAGVDPADSRNRFLFEVPDSEKGWWSRSGKDKADELARHGTLRNYIHPGSCSKVAGQYPDSEGNRVTLVKLGPDWTLTDGTDLSLPERDDVVLKNPDLASHSGFATQAREHQHDTMVYITLESLGKERDAAKAAASQARDAAKGYAAEFGQLQEIHRRQQAEEAKREEAEVLGPVPREIQKDLDQKAERKAAPAPASQPASRHP